MTLMDFSPLQKLQSFQESAWTKISASSAAAEPGREKEGDERRARGEGGQGRGQRGGKGGGQARKPSLKGGASKGKEARRESMAANNLLSSWGLTNALMTPDMPTQASSDASFICPNDRQLSLRAKLVPKPFFPNS